MSKLKSYVVDVKSYVMNVKGYVVNVQVVVGRGVVNVPLLGVTTFASGTGP